MTHSLGTLYLKVKTIQRHRVSWTFSKSFLLTITSIVYRVFPGFCCSIFDSIKFSLIFFLLGRAADVRATLETTLLALAKKKVKFYLILFQVDRRRKIKKKKRQKWKKKKGRNRERYSNDDHNSNDNNNNNNNNNNKMKKIDEGPLWATPFFMVPAWWR